MILIHSNPSHSFHPSRKHSEERRNLQLPPDLVATALENTSDDFEITSTTLINQETSTHDLIAKATESFAKAVKLDDGEGEPEGKEPASTAAKSPPSAASAQAHKKNYLTAANLTESSSSGSVTDSVCTAYESNQGG